MEKVVVFFLQIVGALVEEVLEDEIVTRELLPVNPAGPGFLKVNLQGKNGDPSQLLALEFVRDVPADPWKMTELGESGRRFLAKMVWECERGCR